MNYQQKHNLDTSKIEDMRKRALVVGDKKILAWCDTQLKMRKKTNA